ncbi:MAG: hypothetical protein ACI4WS_08420 [Oscillospiraceae bacterium]
MTDERKLELFDNIIDYIKETLSGFGQEDEGIRDTLVDIGFTEEEADELVFGEEMEME